MIEEHTLAHRVGIVGASGYGGAELTRLLAAHPAMDIAVLAADRSAGAAVSEVFPNLAPGRRFEAVETDRLAELDLVFLATPHAVSARIGGDLVDAGVKVVDLSGAFRLPAEEFAVWYGDSHPRPDLTVGATHGHDGGTAYGLTELARDTVRGAVLVANPGCYPTAALLALAPVADLLEADTVVIDAKSGTSGAGRGVAAHLHHPHVHGGVTAYGAPGHRHTREIEQWLWRFACAPDVWASPPTVSFTPHLVPMARGLLATVYGQATADTTTEDLLDALSGAYRDEPFVRVLASGEFPHTKSLAGSNSCQVAAVADPRTGRVTVTSAIDNLGKGAAGQALQNANLLLGLDETLGLTATGIYP